MTDGRYGMSGWKEFQRNKQDILDEVTKLRQQTQNRPVKTAHGDAAEAKIRQWLSEFLPKKYAVTSGYIVPDLYLGQDTYYHFDVIIYDVLEAPVLWVESNSDTSEQGKFRAIPAKYVRAVYEVKSTFNSKSASDVIKKLEQLTPHASRLHPNFSCGAIFIELKESDINNQNILKKLMPGASIPGFFGGMVIDCSVDKSATATIEFVNCENTATHLKNDKSPLIIPIDEIKMIYQPDGSVKFLGSKYGGDGAQFVAMGGSWCLIKIYNKIYVDGNLGVQLSWSRNGFSDFAMTILGRLDGLTRESSQRPIFAQVFDSIELADVPYQQGLSGECSTFIELGVEKNKDSTQYLDIVESDEKAEIIVTITAQNLGKVPVELSEDKFTNSLCVSPEVVARLSPGIQLRWADQPKEKLEEAKAFIAKVKSGDLPFAFRKKIYYRYLDESKQAHFLCVAGKFEIYPDRFKFTPIASDAELKN